MGLGGGRGDVVVPDFEKAIYANEEGKLRVWREVPLQTEPLRTVVVNAQYATLGWVERLG